MYITISNKCITCGVCSAINPKIFDICIDSIQVNQDSIYGYEDDCIDAALACPVSAIKIEDF